MFAPPTEYHGSKTPNRRTESTGTVLPFRAEGIPEELKARPQWIVWRGKPKENGRLDKLPYDPCTGRLASTTDLMTWSLFVEALAAYEAGGYDGVGFVFCSGDPFCGFDFDDCLDSKTGKIEDHALETIEELGGYREVSPSGRGVHVIVRGKLKRAVKRPWLEAYATERFFTMTGHVLEVRQ